MRVVEISKHEYAQNQKPAVYEVFIGDECVYVGHAAHGFSRIYQFPSAHYNRDRAFNEADNIRVSFYDTESDSSAAEEKLIHERHPRLNMACAVCRTITRYVDVRCKELNQKL